MRLLSILFLTVLMLTGCDNTYHGRLSLLPPHKVPMITADSLVMVLNSQPVLLLDTRSPEEQAVSQLPGALLIDYENFAPLQLDSIPKDQPIVIYCAVGFRSGDVGEQLQREGYTSVHNLYGGILEWKNGGYPVVSPAGAPTEQVHTYSRYWAGYLEEGEAGY
jgi:rhodanese-related sulfurtransferase